MVSYIEYGTQLDIELIYQGNVLKLPNLFSFISEKALQYKLMVTVYLTNQDVIKVQSQINHRA